MIFYVLLRNIVYGHRNISHLYDIVQKFRSKFVCFTHSSVLRTAKQNISLRWPDYWEQIPYYSRPNENSDFVVLAYRFSVSERTPLSEFEPQRQVYVWTDWFGFKGTFSSDRLYPAVAQSKGNCGQTPLYWPKFFSLCAFAIKNDGADAPHQNFWIRHWRSCL